MKKVIISGLVAGIVLLILNMGFSFLISFLLPGIEAQYQTEIFRPWSDPLMWLYFIYPFALAMVLSWT